LEDLERRYRLKSALVAACAALSLTLVVLAAFAQAQRLRFIALKSDFVAAVSHELRTPLASIRVLAETLERRLSDHPVARDYPARIVSDIDGLAFMVENLLELNRLEKGRLRPKLERCELLTLIDELLATSRTWSTKRVEVAVDVPATLEIAADRELLRLCFLNLLRNAASHHVGEVLHLQVSAESARSAVIVRIGDDGPGILPNERKRVFEEFVRGSATRARGTGLGLALCRTIMHVHGGSIRIADSGPRGTTMELRFRARPS
jgi:signal transduction histidine kinase